jgi:hypothetical protein
MQGLACLNIGVSVHLNARVSVPEYWGKVYLNVRVSVPEYWSERVPEINQVVCLHKSGDMRLPDFQALYLILHLCLNQTNTSGINYLIFMHFCLISI